MISKIRIVNFRQIADETIDLSQSVVVIGPNNGGKTTLLQAISLLAISIRTWGAHRINKKSKALKRTGVAINFEDLLNIPISEFKELWRDLNVREGVLNDEGKPTAKNIRIEIHAEGFTYGQAWKVGFEYDYGRDTLIYARLTNDENGNSYDFPELLMEEKIGYLPSVAGLKPIEDKLEVGSILRNIGNGNTSDVLRNICFLLYDKHDKAKWHEFVEIIKNIFRVELNPPIYFPGTGLLKMSYNEAEKKKVDLSSLGSGTKQAILLFAYILAFPNTVNLLDEPDAHLEVIRQSSIYDKISDIAKKNNSQIIVASHSESVLNRAFSKDMVISGMFGKFRIENNKSKISSVLRKFGYEEYIIAKQHPRILYFEGSTDFDLLKAFSSRLGFAAFTEILQNNIYPKAVGNDVKAVIEHFAALKEFIPDLKAYALFDNLRRDNPPNCPADLIIKQWTRNEMENYIPIPHTLYSYIESLNLGPIDIEKFRQIIIGSTMPDSLKDMNHRFWITTKISDDYLTPLFEQFFDQIGYSRNTMDKSKFYQLIEFVTIDEIDRELLNTIEEISHHFNFTT